MSDPPKLPDGVQRFLDRIQGVADKLKEQSDANYRSLGWSSPEEVATLIRDTALIRNKTAAAEPGTEAAILWSIHQVVNDIL